MKKIQPARKNTWKIVSLICMGIFCIMLIGAALRFYHGKASFTDTTPEQMQTAQTLVQQDMVARGMDIASYKVDIARKILHKGTKGQTRTLIRASLESANSQETYLIDLDKNEIVLHSVTTAKDWMVGESRMMPGGWHGKR